MVGPWGENASITHTTQPKPMTAQTQATDQVLTDEQLEELNGGNLMNAMGYIGMSILTVGAYPFFDAIEGSPRAHRDFR